MTLSRAGPGGLGRVLRFPAGPVTLEGNLAVPPDAPGIVLFAHGSGSSRFSSRNRFVAQELQDAGLGTLLIDLLTPAEEEVDLRTREFRFDIPRLPERLSSRRRIARTRSAPWCRGAGGRTWPETCSCIT